MDLSDRRSQTAPVLGAARTVTDWCRLQLQRRQRNHRTLRRQRSRHQQIAGQNGTLRAMSGDHLVAIEDWRINTPAMLADARKRWHLETGPAYLSGSAGLVFPATRRDGSHVVVKLILPHREAEHEADALAAWNGNGAVKLIDRTSDGWILLLERCEPGTPLAAADPNTAISIFAHLLPRLWLPAADSSFTTLRDEAHHWLGSMRANWERAGRPFDQRVLDATMEALAHLAETQGRTGAPASGSPWGQRFVRPQGALACDRPQTTIWRA